jgi:hypothetical protein
VTEPAASPKASKKKIEEPKAVAKAPKATKKKAAKQA